jgi:VanZ family protein
VGTLWCLSSQSNAKPPGPEFEFKDKVLHFGYFFGGGLIAAGFFLRLKPFWPWERAVLAAVIVCGVTGGIDEWHQFYVPERSGNDAADLSADLLGALAGACMMTSIQRRLAPKRASAA